MKVNEPSGGSHAANYDRPKKISRHHVYDERGKFREALPRSCSGESFRVNYTYRRDIILQSSKHEIKNTKERKEYFLGIVTFNL